MQRLLATWTARAAGSLVIAAGLVILVSVPPARPISVGDLDNLSGGSTRKGNNQLVTDNTICNTDVCYNAGGHSYMCQDVGWKITAGPYNYIVLGTMTCGPANSWSLQNCPGNPTGQVNTCNPWTKNYYNDP